MTVRHRRTVLACALVAACAGAQCAKAPPPPKPEPPVTIAAPPEAKVKASMTVAANAEVNPDVNGRPSPIVVRVFQLRADAAFAGAEFFPLFDDEQPVFARMGQSCKRIPMHDPTPVFLPSPGIHSSRV